MAAAAVEAALLTYNGGEDEHPDQIAYYCEHISASRAERGQVKR